MQFLRNSYAILIQFFTAIYIGTWYFSEFVARMQIYYREHSFKIWEDNCFIRKSLCAFSLNSDSTQFSTRDYPSDSDLIVLLETTGDPLLVKTKNLNLERDTQALQPLKRLAFVQPRILRSIGK